MKITKREKILLYMMLEFNIHRYLLANTYGRLDGTEKAEKHIEISSVLFSYIFAEQFNKYKHWRLMMRIHDFLAKILTDRLDKAIEFPTDKTSSEIDYNEFGKRFFNAIINNIDRIEKYTRQV